MCDHSPNREAAMVIIADGIWCDPCLVPLVKALNEGGIRTVASCCGHGKNAGSIALADGRWLVIADEPPSRDQTEDGLAERHDRGCAAGITNGAARCQCARKDPESQEDLIERLTPDCTCPDDLCLGEDGGCSACAQIDPEWDCLRALLADQSDTTASEEDQR